MAPTIDTVRATLIETLELTQRPDALTAETPLFGAIPELDSFGVVQLVAAIEDRFGITIEDDEFGPELFETVGSLADFVDAKIAV